MASKLLLCLLLSQLIWTGLAVPGYSSNVTVPTTSPYGRPSATGVVSHSVPDVPASRKCSSTRVCKVQNGCSDHFTLCRAAGGNGQHGNSFQRTDNSQTMAPIILPHPHARVVRGPPPPDYRTPGSKPYLINAPSPTRTAVNTSTPTPISILNQRYQDQMTSILADPERLCNSRTVRHRVSWNKLPEKDRNAYLTAVHCMHRNLTNLHTNITGSRFRADDFTAHHIVTGGQYVFTGFMLPFHRWMIQNYEDVLRTECGYEGALAYWDFSEHTDDITKDPIFSGDAASMGGDGAPIPQGHGYVELDYPSGKFMSPPGGGGSCLFNQPFKLISARLGYSFPWGSDSNKTVVYPLPQCDEAGSLKSTDALVFNDRCLTRDLNSFAGEQLHLTHVEYDLSCQDVGCLQERLNGAQKGYPFILNLMNAARSAIGGDSLDPYAGPSDPMYYLVAANIDRLWAIWQAQDPSRRYQTGGTHLPAGKGELVKSSDEMLSADGAIRPVSDFGSTVDGTLCYRYD